MKKDFGLRWVPREFVKNKGVTEKCEKIKKKNETHALGTRPERSGRTGNVR